MGLSPHPHYLSNVSLEFLMMLVLLPPPQARTC